MAQLDKPGLLARLARVVADTDTRESLESRLCRAYLAVLGGDGAALTLAYTRQERATLCTTDELAASLDDLQDVLGEGPGAAAFESGELAVAKLGAGRQRWPLFAEAALKAVGPRIVYAVPMRPGSEVLGVLTVHERSPRVPEAEQALFLGDAIGAALLRERSPRMPDPRSGSWAGRAGIHQATGMVIAQLKVGAEDALALLRAHAYAHDLTLAEVAGEVVDRRLNFVPDDGEGGKR